MTNPNDDMLDDLFATARTAAPAPDDALVARVLADAATVQAGFDAAPQQSKGLWARAMDMIGGWPAVTGLATATIAGIWVGVAPPASVEDLTATFIGDEVTISLFSNALMIDGGTLTDG